MRQTLSPPPTPVFTPVDPRIRQRRVAVRRAAGRRRLRVVMVACGLSGLTVGAWALARSPLLDVDHVRVRGADHLGPDAVRSAAGVGTGTAMVDVDATSVARAVETLPWVARARVVRDWPSTVVIEVTERLAVAVTRHADGHWSVLDVRGLVLQRAVAPPEGLVVVEGLAGSGDVGHTLENGADVLGAAAALPAGLRAAVVAMVAEPDGVTARLRGGGVARLGRAERLPEKFRALETVLTKVDLRGLAVLDVRHPSSPVLTRAEVPPRVSTLSTG